MSTAVAQAAMAVPADLVELGVLRGSYGLQGWVHVQPHSGEASVLRAARQWWLLPARRIGSGPAQLSTASGASDVLNLSDVSDTSDIRCLEVSGVREQGAGLVAKWHGCEDPEAAQALKGRAVAVSRSQFPRLPAGEFYWVDLLGALVVDRGDRQLGVVRGLRSNGAHDLLEIERAGAPEGASAAMMLIPIVGEYVDGIDVAARRIRVDWDPQW